MSDYGYCPQCGAPGRTRERRLNGNDVCQNGHVYPSRSARNEPKIVEILRRHDAGEEGYRVGDMILANRLLAALGWQGGTIHDALAEARRRVDANE